MSYNPHDDEGPISSDRRPFPPNYNRGKPNTKLRSAQNWDVVFTLLGAFTILPVFLIMGTLMMLEYNDPIGYIDVSIWVYAVVHLTMLFFAQRMVHKQGFRCPPASI